MSDNHPESLRQQILQRVKSMTFSCIYCDASNPVSLTAMDYKPKGSGPHVMGFFVCPDCRNKFMVKIEDLGKVGHV